MLKKINTSPSQSQQENQKKLDLIQLLYELPDQALSIVNYLLRINNRFQRIFPTQQTIATNTGLCRRTVNKWCQRLQRMGIFHMLYKFWDSSEYTFNELFQDLSFRSRISHILVSCRFIPLHHIYIKSLTHIYKLKEVINIENAYCPFYEREFVLDANVVGVELLKDTEKWESDLEQESRIAYIYESTGELGYDRVYPGSTQSTQRVYAGDDCLCSQGFTGQCSCGQTGSTSLCVSFGCL